MTFCTEKQDKIEKYTSKNQYREQSLTISDEQRIKLTERFVLIELSESLFCFGTQPLEQTFDLKFPPSDTTSGESRLVLMCC